MVTWGNIACKVPWSMITIGPGGELKLCCSTHEHASHISKQDSLLDWFNGEYYNEVRKKFTNKDTVNYLKEKGCKLFYKKSILSGEHPESFKATSAVLKSGKKHNLFSKVLKTKQLYILKS